MDWNLVITIAVFLEGLLLLRGLMELSRQIEEGLEDLDTTLAGAIKSVIEGASFEPVNPIQQALANMLQSNLQTRRESDIIEVTRSTDGKFSSANDN